MEKLNRAQKCSILGPQNLGLIGGSGSGAPLGSAAEHGSKHYCPSKYVFGR